MTYSENNTHICIGVEYRIRLVWIAPDSNEEVKKLSSQP